jgi:hypothetical protein
MAERTALAPAGLQDHIHTLATKTHMFLSAGWVWRLVVSRVINGHIVARALSKCSGISATFSQPICSMTCCSCRLSMMSE